MSNKQLTSGTRSRKIFRWNNRTQPGCVVAPVIYHTLVWNSECIPSFVSWGAQELCEYVHHRSAVIGVEAIVTAVTRCFVPRSRGITLIMNSIGCRRSSSIQTLHTNECHRTMALFSLRRTAEPSNDSTKQNNKTTSNSSSIQASKQK